MEGSVPTEGNGRIEGGKVTEIKALMRQKMDRLSAENKKVDGKLLVEIGKPHDISRAQVFPTPLTDRPEQSPNERDRYLVVSEDGFKIIECETEDLRRRIGSIIETLVEDSSRMVYDPVRYQRHLEEHLGFRSPGAGTEIYIPSTNGLRLESAEHYGSGSTGGGFWITREGSVIRTERKVQNKGEPIKDVRLTSDPDPDLVSSIMLLNKNRAEEEKNNSQKVKEKEQAKVDQSIRAANKVDEIFDLKE